jgi:hypothetical protein
MNHRLKVVGLDEARYECVFPTCGGVCCKNGRPGLEPAEVVRIEGKLAKFLPSLTPNARKRVERDGFITRRIKEGRPTLAVVDGWCVFFNEGCVLHKVGAAEGDKAKYKPWHCMTFPLALDEKTDEWYVRQWGVRDEGWDLFCLNPEESPKPAADTLRDEIDFAERFEKGNEAWRRRAPKGRR